MPALYRKYRPVKLRDVVGQDTVVQSLASAIQNHKISHAYLFVGPRGTGKTSVARILAHAVNGFDYQLEDDYLDIIEIDAASNTGIDNIRELREKAIIAPSKGKYKVYIIDEAHMLSKSASNALLKTLEEPPEHVIFIMATTDAHKIPVTIASRALVYTFHLASPEIMKPLVADIAKKEGINIEDNAIDIVVARGGGSFRDTLSLLDQVASLPADKITAEILENAFGLPNDKLVQSIITSYQSGDSTKINDILKQLLSSGLTAENIARAIIDQIFATPQPALMPLLSKLTDVSAPFAEAKLLVALLETTTSMSETIPLPSPAFDSSSPSLRVSSSMLARGARKAGSGNEIASDAEASSSATSDFNFSEFLAALSADIGLQTKLRNCDHGFKDDVLHLYPRDEMSYKILNSTANVEKLQKVLQGKGLLIHNVDKKRSSAIKNDQQLSELSDIMGADVEIISGDLPL